MNEIVIITVKSDIGAKTRVKKGETIALLRRRDRLFWEPFYHPFQNKYVPFVIGYTCFCTMVPKGKKKKRRPTMNKKEQERDNRQKNLNEYNSITQKVKPENQNQTHNVRKEGIQPINQKR